ncbi:MAG: Rne/Rng family ribonuclease, partial [Phycisphaerales bacterium]|nr:Rne/Rng family ribonuclease [Phycisphaerales bacterium]
MVVNDAMGEECRIAILQNGRLDDLYAERAATATSVGNIYKGRVTNVEQAIQAAFVDFGHAQKGFLHYSDLHPRYFPGGDKTEKVGKKTARRERPPLQECLKKGDEVLVQVIKEGIGTKGPTLTSYLSIPGRLMVMMPHMDKVGVTRRVEDDAERKAMRAVLDKLDLPDNFGFIVRTAGMGQSRTELKRDVAYLTRLWKVMEKRIDTAGTPCELYTESDLVLRTIRDNLHPDIEAIVVDSESAYDRVSAFLRVVAPRSAPPVLHYRRSMPIFHAFEVERQIEMIHSREVPLPSGGALVIDQTEALVAIDVNSGRSRRSRDAETNAFNTNMEAAEEICRQLRLRDMGGIIVNDFIDMRQHRHRREVLAKFKDGLKRDRARTTVLPISDLGLLEMTRQRMRPSLRMANYVECQHCTGQGEIKSADAVANDVLREVGFLLHCGETARIEVVVSPRVASSLLSTRRRMLDAIEQRMGKQVDVRIIETFAGDRVEFYAYDARGADLELDNLTPGARPTVAELQAEMELSEEELESDVEKAARSRRRRRRRKAPPADATAIALSEDFARELDEIEAQAEEEEAREEEAAKEAADAPTKKRRRRRRRRRRKIEPLITEAARLHVLAKAMGVTSKEILAKFTENGGEEGTGFAIKSHASSVTPDNAVIIQGWFAPQPEPEAEGGADEAKPEASEDGEGTKKKRRRRRRGGRGRRRKSDDDTGDGQSAESSGEAVQDDTPGDDEAAPKKKTRSRRSRKKSESKSESPTDTAAEAPAEEGGTKKRSRRRAKPKADSTVESKPDPA